MLSALHGSLISRLQNNSIVPMLSLRKQAWGGGYVMYLGSAHLGVREKGSSTRAVSLRGPRLSMHRILGVGAAGWRRESDRPISESAATAGTATSCLVTLSWIFPNKGRSSIQIMPQAQGSYPTLPLSLSHGTHSKDGFPNWVCSDLGPKVLKKSGKPCIAEILLGEPEEGPAGNNTSL